MLAMHINNSCFFLIIATQLTSVIIDDIQLTKTIPNGADDKLRVVHLLSKI